MSPRQAFALIPLWAKVAGLAAGLVVGGATVGQRWLGLPATVAAHERRLAEVEAVARRVDRQYARLVCLITLPDSLSAIEGERRCP